MYKINGTNMDLKIVESIAYQNEKLEIDESCFQQIKMSAKRVKDFVNESKVVYGVTTGFGALASVHIDAPKSAALQKNLILSHAAGVGEPLPVEVVRTMMLLRINSLVKGYSGIRLETLQILVDFLNKGITPYVPAQGSVGASGDLAPLAHMAMAMLGEGKVYYKGEITGAKEAMESEHIQPFVPAQKEGLALLNGTQMMSSLLSNILIRAYNLFEWTMISASITIDALKASTAPFDPRIHDLRPHPGQTFVAKRLLDLLDKSEIRESHKNCGKVQDAYSLRAIPQVFGAVKDTFDYAKIVLEREFNSVTDNPIIFENEAISGGNFHGEPIALVADFVAIALTELSNITERRIDRLVNPLVSSLPPFLAKGEEGLNSGFMIWQYTAASLVSENKALSHPGSVDSIPTSAFQEDHVSMGSVSVRKAFSIIGNCEKVTTIELMLALRGLCFLRPMKTGKLLEFYIERFQQTLKPHHSDRYFGDDFQSILDIIRNHNPLKS
ncbi:MAG TPA: histidine ammonia-lyase [Thermotogota bacterium]|nr:histidine ammonia-lyase [Thermotogota bacterium]HRW33741.1 histidine ammonia-lyase [Thermotogota bacterium]